MNKKFSFLFLFFVVQSIFSQVIFIDLQDFTQANITNGVKVNFTPGEENKAVIRGKNKEKVVLGVKNGIFKVNMALNHIWREDDTLVEVFYKELDKIEARQGSEIELCGSIKQTEVDFISKEGSKITAHIDVNKLSVNAVTKGTVKVIGKADEQDILIKGEGEFMGANLTGNNIRIRINGGGLANINSTESVNAKVKAGGIINIFGNPDVVEEDIRFGGTIKMIK